MRNGQRRCPKQNHLQARWDVGKSKSYFSLLCIINWNSESAVLYSNWRTWNVTGQRKNQRICMLLFLSVKMNGGEKWILCSHLWLTNTVGIHLRQSQARKNSKLLEGKWRAGSNLNESNWTVIQPTPYCKKLFTLGHYVLGCASLLDVYCVS